MNPPSSLPGARLPLLSALLMLTACCGKHQEQAAPDPHDSKHPDPHASAAARPPEPQSKKAPQPAASAAKPAASAAAAPATAAPAGPAEDITLKAVEGVNASTAFKTNTPTMAADGKTSTAWSAKGNNVWVELGLRPGTHVSEIELSGQRADKYGSLERWDASAVISHAVVTWEGGQGEVRFDRARDKGVRKRVAIGKQTGWVRVFVKEISEGNQQNSRIDVDIDEIKVFGSTTEPPAKEPSAFSGKCKAGFVSLGLSAGTVTGGSLQESAVDSPYVFFPIPVRVDDGKWHNLGIRYSFDVDPTGLPINERASKIVRFKIEGDQFTTEIDHKTEEKGKCSKLAKGAFLASPQASAQCRSNKTKQGKNGGGFGFGFGYGDGCGCGYGRRLRLRLRLRLRTTATATATDDGCGSGQGSTARRRPRSGTLRELLVGAASACACTPFAFSANILVLLWPLSAPQP